MQDSHSEFRELAVLDELAQMRERLFFGLRHELDEVEHALHDCALEVVSAFVP